MKVRTTGDYEIENQEVAAEGADMRVLVLTLAAGQSVPWHHHSEIADTFFCLEGIVVVQTRAPHGITELTPGERFTVAAKTAHATSGKDKSRCTFMLVQSVGVYDFVPVGG